jgi:hypothetical protein
VIHRFHRLLRLFWTICAICVICGPAFAQTGTTVTGVSKTSDQLTPQAAGRARAAPAAQQEEQWKSE